MEKLKNYEVIIIGGGIYGCACAYYLGKENKDVLLIEKDRIASSGATSYSRGIVRAYDEDNALADLSLRGAIRLGNWEKENLPGSSPYTASGFLYLIAQDQAEMLARYAAEYGTKEYPIRLLSPSEVRKKFPWIKNASKQVGLYEEKGGYGDPRSTAIKLVEGFRANGGSLYENCEVTGFEKNSDGSWKVHLPHASLTAKVVLFTTGAYTKNFFPKLPLFTRSISMTQITDSNSEVKLAVIDEAVGTYLRPNDGASFYCGSQVFEIADYPSQLAPHDMAASKDTAQMLQHLFSKQAQKVALSSFKGFDCYTPKKKPITQFLKDYEGVYLATGFSGRGYKCALVLGEMIADEINDYLGLGNPAFESNKWKLNITNNESTELPIGHCS